MTTTLTMVLYGDSGAGKTTLAVTAPGPRLILDAEGGTQWAVVNPVKWNPLSEDPPEVKGDDTVVVTVKSLKELASVTQWIQSGRVSGFRSITVDSLMEIQKRMIDQTAGVNAMEIRDWGTVLRQMEIFVRALRDQTMQNGHSIPCIVFTAGAVNKDGRTKPFLQGQIAELIPYFVDVQGYLAVAQGEDGQLERRLLISPINGFAAKDRTGVLTRQYGPVITNPNISQMLNVLEEASASRSA